MSTIGPKRSVKCEIDHEMAKTLVLHDEDHDISGKRFPAMSLAGQSVKISFPAMARIMEAAITAPPLRQGSQ